MWFAIKAFIFILLLFIILCFYREVQMQNDLIDFIIKENTFLKFEILKKI